MKKLFLILLMVIIGYQLFSQSNNRLMISKEIITNTNGKILVQGDDYIKSDYPTKYTLYDIETICDTFFINPNGKFPLKSWNLNSDKNYEKEFTISGKKLLITIYENDKVLYFEFPK